MDALDLEALRRTRGVDLTVWPPRHDPGYRPRPDETCWLPEVECAPAAARDDLIYAKLRSQLAYAWERCPFYRRRFEQAGLEPGDLRSPEDLAGLPVLEKRDIQEQGAEMVAGDWPQDDLIRNQTGGSTGTPVTFYLGRDRKCSRSAATLRTDSACVRA